MRLLIALLFVALTSPALAQYWTHYDNARFGYGIDIPPGFEGDGESDNGDGQSFHNLSRAQGLVVWGGLLTADFETEVQAALAAAGANAWTVTEQTTTPQWAHFSAIKGQRLLHQRMMLLCEAAGYAAFRIEYPVTDTAEMQGVIQGLTRSFAASGCQAGDVKTSGAESSNPHRP